MKLYQSIILVFFTSYSINYVFATSPARMVREGAIRKAALHEAINMCPNFIDHKRKAELIQEIKRLLAPAYSAHDPNRKSYDVNYIPSTEERNAKAAELCHGDDTSPFTESQATTIIESDSPTEVLTLNEDQLHLDAQEKSREFKEVFNPGKYFFFLFGTVCGMLTVFVYFHVTGLVSKQFSAPNPLRRPEL